MSGKTPPAVRTKDLLRTKISGDKFRFYDGTFNLDLTYITDRIIAMSLPAEGMEATYRNPLEEVANMLDTYHLNHYFIYNLSQRNYNLEKFHYRVESIGWEDHTAPPLHLLWHLCLKIDKYLSEDPKNVVVVNCLAGKGRTGTVIASYFLYCKLFEKADISLLYFAVKRSGNNWGVVVPSQRRYVNYIQYLLEDKYIPDNILLLESVELSSIPPFDVLNKSENNISIEVTCLTNPDHPLALFSQNNLHKPVTNMPERFVIDTHIGGDILIVIQHSGALRTPTIAKFQFHVGMIGSDRIVFHKSTLDESFKDSRLPENFEVTLFFKSVDQSTDQYAKLVKKFKPKLNISKSPILFGSLPFYFNTEEQKHAKIKEIQNITRNLHSKKGGWLEKQGDTLKMWRNRWFSLKNDHVAYYSDPKNVNPKGIIKLDDISKIVRKGELSFDIQTTTRVHHIRSHHQNECHEWMEAISNAMMHTGEDPLQNTNFDLLYDTVSSKYNEKNPDDSGDIIIHSNNNNKGDEDESFLMENLCPSNSNHLPNSNAELTIIPKTEDEEFDINLI